MTKSPLFNFCAGIVAGWRDMRPILYLFWLYIKDLKELLP